ncbi:MAG: hypothetical protein EZS28_031266 [Streblomastix strix]|uniref:Uncharacterized protein n=1 Tax=Streblomastix strix TaxID=222440 RepID=A0A5J4UR96_9EUKA|nr:MAG: hypothetical protein EZS28_031266 [Streblomastix strix]
MIQTGMVTGQKRNVLRSREPMGMKTGWRMKSVERRWKNRDKSNIRDLAFEVNPDKKSYKVKDTEKDEEQTMQRYEGLIQLITEFQRTMQPDIDQEKLQGREILPGQYRHYPNKDGPAFFYHPKNYKLTQSLKATDL